MKRAAARGGAEEAVAARGNVEEAVADEEENWERRGEGDPIDAVKALLMLSFLIDVKLWFFDRWPEQLLLWKVGGASWFFFLTGVMVKKHPQIGSVHASMDLKVVGKQMMHW